MTRTLTEKELRLHHARKSFRAEVFRWRYIAHSLLGYARNMLGKKSLGVDFGPAMRSQSDGTLVPNEKTIARSESLQQLRANYAGWVGAVEAEIFLMGFEAGVEWQSRSEGEPAP